MSESTGGVLSIVSNWQISLEQIKDQIQNKSVKRRKRKNMAWYDSAVFYHIYPLGLCGCSKENTGIAEDLYQTESEGALKACYSACIYLIWHSIGLLWIRVWN